MGALLRSTSPHRFEIPRSGIGRKEGLPMDMSGLTLGYNDYLSMAKDVSATKTENAANAISKDSTDEELMSACKQFESYLLEQVFKEMQKTISFDDDEKSPSIGFSMGGDDSLTEYFKEQAIATLASDSTERSGLGIAQMLYEAMKRGQ